MRKGLKITLIVLAVIVSLLLVFCAWFYISIITACGDALEVDTLDAHDNGRKNVLIVGTDASGLRSDVIMVMSFPEEDGAINLMSIPRDTYAQINGGSAKINSALNYGDDMVVSEIKELLGIEIHDYVKVNFNAVAGIVDALGGIEFYVPADMNYDDPAQDLHIHLKKGMQTLDGQKAVQLMRFRGYAMADIERTRVQRRFIKAAFTQKGKAKYISAVPEILDVVGENMQTSVSSGGAIGYMIDAFCAEGMQTIEIPYYLDSTYVHVDQTKLKPLMDASFK